MRSRYLIGSRALIDAGDLSRRVTRYERRPSIISASWSVHVHDLCNANCFPSSLTDIVLYLTLLVGANPTLDAVVIKFFVERTATPVDLVYQL